MTRYSPTLVLLTMSVVLLTAGSQASASELGTVASRMVPGSWVELDTIGFGAPLLDDVGGHHILQYSDNAEWYPVTRQVLFLGQGHASNYDGDPTTISRFIVYTASGNEWSVAPAIPSGDVGHGYDHSAIDIGHEEFFHRPFNSLIVYRYRLATGLWDALPPRPISQQQVAGALEYSPELDGLLLVDGDWGVWLWDRASNQWTLLANTNGTIDPGLPFLPMGPYHNVAEYSPVHRVIVFGGGNDSNGLYRLDAAGTITPMAPAPIDVGVANHTVVTVDPVAGNLLVFGVDETFWELDPVADTWLPVTSSRPPFFDHGPNGTIFGVVATPIDGYGVALFLNYDYDNSKVYLYKHTAGGGLVFADGFESADSTAWSIVLE